jgi:hypothetical protein
MIASLPSSAASSSTRPAKNGRDHRIAFVARPLVHRPFRPSSRELPQSRVCPRGGIFDRKLVNQRVIRGRVKRSTRCSFRWIPVSGRFVKLVVSTTSVFPSQCPPSRPATADALRMCGGVVGMTRCCGLSVKQETYPGPGQLQKGCLIGSGGIGILHSVQRMQRAQRPLLVAVESCP